MNGAGEPPDALDATNRRSHTARSASSGGFRRRSRPRPLIPWSAQNLPEVAGTLYVVVPFEGGSVGALPLEDALELPEVGVAELEGGLMQPVAGGWARRLEIDRAGIVWLTWEPLDETPLTLALLPVAVQADA